MSTSSYLRQRFGRQIGVEEHPHQLPEKLIKTILDIYFIIDALQQNERSKYEYEIFVNETRLYIQIAKKSNK